MRRLLIFAGLVLLGFLFTPDIGLATDIDATSLTAPTFRIGQTTPPGPTLGPFPSSSVLSLALGTGTYVFSDEANGAFSFDVDAGGNVAYAPADEPFLNGAGTTTLGVRGYDITVDATALTCPTFRVPHVFASTATAAVVPMTVLPGDYGIDDSGSNEVVFYVDHAGHIQVPAGNEDYMFGVGTANIVIRGFDFTVDATALSSPTFRLLGHTPIGPTSVVLAVTGIPGFYSVYEVASNNVSFTLDADGHIHYPAGFENQLSGEGSSALKVDGFTVTIEPCGLAALYPTFGLLGHYFDGASTSLPRSFVGIPGYYALVTPSGPSFFQMDGSGNVFDLPPTVDGVATSGAGTSTLSIGSCATSGDLAGHVLATCPAAGTPLLGVHVDAFEVGSGDLAGSAVTDASGAYAISGLPSGSYTVTCVTPLGYASSPAQATISIASGGTATADFSMSCVATTGTPRTIGFWMHNVGVATGGKGAPQVTASALCGYLDLIAVHFNDNAINPVAVYQPPASGSCPDKLQAAKALLNLQGATPMINRARQQFMALLLNVAAGYLGQTQVISADGATVSQAITYCDHLIDNPSGDRERAKTIADTINNGGTVPAGMIPLSTAQIAYRRGMEKASFRSVLRSGGGAREFHFATGAAGPVHLAVYDVSGRLVSEVYHGAMGAGVHSVSWSGGRDAGGRLARGVYFARLLTPRESATLKITNVGLHP